MRSAARFVDRLAPDDRLALVAVPGPGVLVDFTAQHERVREGLLAIVGQKQPFVGRFNISLSEALATVEHSDAMRRAQLMQRECGFALQSAVEANRCELEVEQEAGEMVAQQRQETQSSLRGMHAVLQSLASLDGPKSVILISEGLVLEGLSGDVDSVAALAADVRASLDVMLLDVPAVDVSQSQRPSTPREDRDLHVQGLETLAGAARGSLHRIPAGADAAFARISRSLEGYYLLGLDAKPEDHDGRRHRIQIRTKRRGVIVNSRRGFLSTTSPAATSPADAVKRALGAPLVLADLPVRLATWTFKEPGTTRVRVLLAAEIDRRAEGSLDYTTGLVVLDREGRTVANSIAPRTLQATESDERRALYAGAVSLDPGTYLLRVAFADGEGRIGSVERRVNAWQMDPATLTVGDLLLGSVPQGAVQSLAPTVEAPVQERLAAIMEVYASDGVLLDAAQAMLEILPAGGDRPVLTAPMQRGPAASADTRSLQAELSTTALPPGRYLARAIVRDGSEPKGHVTRPFRVIPSPDRAPSTAASPASASGLPAEMRQAMVDSVAPFDARELLGPEILGEVLVSTARDRPSAVQSALKEAQAGRFGPAALAALEAGDQALASFLRGIDWLSKGQHDRGAQQLQVSMQMAPGFAPARLYLGAALAQSNRHREAASLLQSVPAEVARTAPMGRMAGVSWLRAGEAGNAIAVLEKSGGPGMDLETARLLGLAYVAGNRPADALPLLATYLDSHPSDPEALLAGIYATYASHVAAPRSGTLAADQARAATWAKAYAAQHGSEQGLVDLWVDYLKGTQRR